MKSYFTVFCFLMLFIAATFTTSFAQTEWTKYTNNPVMTLGVSDSWNAAGYTPGCILFDGETYHAWWGGTDGSTSCVGYFTSTDGITWIEYANNPVLDMGPAGSWDDEGVLRVYVRFDNELYHMWYTGWDGKKERIGYATSPDGIAWTKYVGNPVLNEGTAGSWEEDGVLSPCVHFDGVNYYMWYEGANWPNASIGFATSQDGLSWTKHAGNPVLTGIFGNWDYPRVEGPQVYFDGTTYHMWYTGAADAWLWRIGYATSADGISWTKFSDKPVLDKGAPGDWDDQFAAFGTVVVDTTNHIYKMWYGGGKEDVTAVIGYATAPFNLNVPGDYATIQEAIDAAHDGNVVLVDEGTYFENINFKGKAITVASYYYFDGDTSHISNTIIDGSQNTNPDSGSVVYFISGEDTTSVLCGFTITGGSGSYWPGWDMYGGGGIMMDAGGKVLHNKITGNHLVSTKGLYGAGIVASSYEMKGNIVIEQNDITYNSIVSPKMSGGGGIQIPLRWWKGGYCRVKNNIISNNSVTCTGTFKTVGGGLILSLTLPTIGEVIIENNIVSRNELHCVAAIGAGIYVAYFEPGGTIIDNNPIPIIQNNIITNNYSQDKGGGLGVWTVENNHQSNSFIAPQPAFINNTIVNNKAKDGCGMFNYDSYPLLLNNIMWNDLSASGSREIFNDDIDYPEYSDHINNGIISMHYSNVQGGWVGEGNRDAEPLFVDAANGDFNLNENSPGIGWGVDSIMVNGKTYTCPALDYYGNIRPNSIDAGVDMGAIESEYVTDIKDKVNPFPTIFALNQNYPNPFNPTTTISYSLKGPLSGQLSAFSQVDLSIYNILGQKVATLVSGKQPAGTYKVEWDASAFASGIYFYRMETDKGFVQSRKLVLMK